MVAGYVSQPRRTVLADVVATTWARQATLVVGYAVAIALAAQVVIPLPYGPVPLTLQTFAVLLGAAALGPGRAVSGALLYVGVGALGVPWFAVTGGATVGYLVGFVVAAALVGRVAQAGRDRRPLQALALMAVGNVVIYACGVTGLVAVTGAGIGHAVAIGVVPFVVGDGLKIAVAGLALPAVWRRVDRA